MNNDKSSIPLLIFAGSARKDSWNRQLAQAVADMAKAEGADVTVLELGELNLPLYDGDLEDAGRPANVIRLKQILKDHPAWIICTPEYNGSYTPLLKNTIDWASRPLQNEHADLSGAKPFEGTVVGLLATAPGPIGGMTGLGQTATLLRKLMCWVAPRQFALGKSGEAFDPDGRIATDANRQQVQAVIEQVLTTARKLRA
ncbi:NAD(P)H-dependent oxidoreductase [Hydrogenophaga sp. 5NK40-0174]|uniref:NADPH-dependent FMN reductase n=1 Tax=Hydrogenophaga sp. 5NK40-0174 TaxID=3127649 RepID=UPI003106A44B